MGIDRSVLLGLFLLMVSGCGGSVSGPQPLSTVDRKQIAGFRDAHRLAVMRGDAQALRAGYAPDAIVLPHGRERVQGTEALRKYSEDFVKGPKPAELEFTPIYIYGADGLAYEVGAYRWASAPEDGDKMTSVTGVTGVTGTYVWVFKKQPDGAWKLAAAMTNTTQPPSGTDIE